MRSNAAVDSHLYVVDAKTQTIVEFPITGHSVSVDPDKTLDVHIASPRYLSTIESMAIDASGNAYVLIHTKGERQGQLAKERVDVYAAGASGRAAPIRTLQVPVLATALTFDDAGNLYVNTDTNGATGYDVYAPGASGSDAPKASFSEKDVAAFTFSGGLLFGMGARSVTTYHFAATNPVSHRRYCMPSVPSGGSAYENYGMAIDPSRKTLFVAQRNPVRGGYNRVAFFVLDKFQCPINVKDSLQSDDLVVTGGIASIRGYLFVASTTTVYEFKTATGPGAKPIATLNGLSEPGAILIGP